MVSFRSVDNQGLCKANMVLSCLRGSEEQVSLRSSEVLAGDDCRRCERQMYSWFRLQFSDTHWDMRYDLCSNGDMAHVTDAKYY